MKQMKVILINGSPRKNGCTYTALSEVRRGLMEHGVDGEIIQLGTSNIPGCEGCSACRKLGKCIKDDVVNELAGVLEQADGMVIGSPVYFSSPNAGLLALLDRLYAAHGKKLMHKPCGCVVSARRAGTTASLEVLHKYPLINEQPLVASSYWCMVYGSTPEEVRADEEGMSISYNLGRNMAWMVKALNGAAHPSDRNSR